MRSLEKEVGLAPATLPARCLRVQVTASDPVAVGPILAAQGSRETDLPTLADQARRAIDLLTLAGQVRLEIAPQTLADLGRQEIALLI
jgi:hypothetical protein